MAKQIRILDFYADLLLETAAWAKEQSAGDAALANYGQQIFNTLSAGERALPAAGLQAILAQLPAFTERFPHKRTVLSHLDKYLEAILRGA